MGFRQQGKVTPLFGAGQGKAAAERPGSLCPAPPWLKAPVTFEMRDTWKGSKTLRNTKEMLCGRRCLCCINSHQKSHRVLDRFPLQLALSLGRVGTGLGGDPVRMLSSR